jgi:hypothetical protein
MNRPIAGVGDEDVMVQQNGEGRAAAVLFVGFDSAWVDSARGRGAICAASFDGQRFAHFKPSQPVGFDKAPAFIRSVHRDDRPWWQSTSQRSSLMPRAAKTGLFLMEVLPGAGPSFDPVSRQVRPRLDRPLR